MARREPTLMEFIDAKREQIAIDRNALDEMWVAQPQIYQEIAERLALEISNRDEMKDQIKDLEAELDGILRAEAVENEVKVTNDSIKAAIRDDKKFKKLNEQYLVLQRGVAQLGALKETFMMRRYALQDLTSLHISGYAMQSSSKPSRERVGDRSREILRDERKRRSRDQEEE